MDLPTASSLSHCLGPKKGTSILVRVVKLLRLSIVTPSKKYPESSLDQQVALASGA